MKNFVVILIFFYSVEAQTQLNLGSILNILGGGGTTTPAPVPGQNCFSSAFGPNWWTTGPPFVSDLSNAVNNQIAICQADPDVQKGDAISPAAQKLLSAVNSGGSLVDSINAAAAQSCAIQAKLAYCQSLQQQYSMNYCNMCYLIALGFRPDEIKSCTCASGNNGNLGASQTATATIYTSQRFQQCVVQQDLSSVVGSGIWSTLKCGSQGSQSSFQG